MLSLFLSICSLIITYFSLKFIIPFLSRNLKDIPNKRSSHHITKPKGGGIAIVFSCITLNFIFNSQYTNLYLICLPLAIIGLLDDKYNLPRYLRYLIQLITTISLLNNSYFSIFYNSSNIYKNIFIFLFLIILGTSIINFTNFMDGIDGLLTSCLIIFFISISLSISPSFFIITGSLVAFLFYNWYPSLVFMGDVGSTFLGGIVFASLLKTNNLEHSLGYLLICTPLFADALICIFRRILNKQKIFEAHNLHLYQRLYQKGISQSKISLIYFSSSILISIVLFKFGIYASIFASILVILLGFYLDFKVALPFKSMK